MKNELKKGLAGYLVIIVSVAFVVLLSGCASPTPKSDGNKETLPTLNPTFVSGNSITCVFEKADLWSPEMPWDGSYICTGSVIIDFGGVSLPKGTTMQLVAKNIPINDLENTAYAFDKLSISSSSPLNKATFKYSTTSMEYFEKNRPQCPGNSINGLTLTVSNSALTASAKYNLAATIPIVCT